MVQRLCHLHYRQRNSQVLSGLDSRLCSRARDGHKISTEGRNKLSLFQEVLHQRRVELRGVERQSGKRCLGPGQKLFRWKKVRTRPIDNHTFCTECVPPVIIQSSSFEGVPDEHRTAFPWPRHGRAALLKIPLGRGGNWLDDLQKGRLPPI